MPSSEQADAVIHMPAMMVLRPGDRVLLAFGNDPDEDEVVFMQDVLHKAFPGTAFVLVTDVESVTVQAAPPTKRQLITAAGA